MQFNFAHPPRSTPPVEPRWRGTPEAIRRRERQIAQEKLLTQQRHADRQRELELNPETSTKKREREERLRFIRSALDSEAAEARRRVMEPGDVFRTVHERGELRHGGKPNLSGPPLFQQTGPVVEIPLNRYPPGAQPDASQAARITRRDSHHASLAIRSNRSMASVPATSARLPTELQQHDTFHDRHDVGRAKRAAAPSPSTASVSVYDPDQLFVPWSCDRSPGTTAVRESVERLKGNNVPRSRSQISRRTHKFPVLSDAIRSRLLELFLAHRNDWIFCLLRQGRDPDRLFWEVVVKELNEPLVHGWTHASHAFRIAISRRKQLGLRRTRPADGQAGDFDRLVDRCLTTIHSRKHLKDLVRAGKLRPELLPGIVASGTVRGTIRQLSQDDDSAGEGWDDGDSSSSSDYETGENGDDELSEVPAREPSPEVVFLGSVTTARAAMAQETPAAPVGYRVVPASQYISPNCQLPRRLLGRRVTSEETPTRPPTQPAKRSSTALPATTNKRQRTLGDTPSVDREVRGLLGRLADRQTALEEKIDRRDEAQEEMRGRREQADQEILRRLKAMDAKLDGLGRYNTEE